MALRRHTNSEGRMKTSSEPSCSGFLQEQTHSNRFSRFLDAQRIHNLEKYLQALHKGQYAIEQHTTLLLNCYTRLKDVSRLDEFIMTKNREADCDVKMGITVCRQSGYCKHALVLGEKYKQHEHCLKIQQEDIKAYQKTLQYIGKPDFEVVESSLKQYGKILMYNVLKDTIDLVKHLCTDYKQIDRSLINQYSLEGGIP